MGKTRQSANLVSDNNIFVDIATDRVGIGSTIPKSNLDVNGSLNVSGVVTATSFTGNINSSGINTFSSGPVLVGSSTSTGTASQRLQVTGGAYISSSVGIGTTNPQYPLDVNGDLQVTGTLRSASILAFSVAFGM